MRRSRALWTVIAAISALFACGEKPTEPTNRGQCRTYPVDVLDDGTTFHCALEYVSGQPWLACRAGRERSYGYASVVDFVDEAVFPNKYLRVNERSASFGMLVSSSSTTVTYIYDDQRRMIERRRDGWTGVAGPFHHDTTTFTTWDAMGRPLAGVMTRLGSTIPITIAYDDARRTVNWSNGESVTQDGNGNTIAETLVFGTFVSSRSYRILSTAQICK